MDLTPARLIAWARLRQTELGTFASGAAIVAIVVFAINVSGVTAANHVARTDRVAIEHVVHDYILTHPEIIPEAINGMQSREVTKLLTDNRREIETPFAGSYAGNKDGDVVLVEFFDYACPYCRSAHADIRKLIAADPGLKVVYRDFPVLSPESDEAALASLAAAQQGRYSAFHDRMFDDPGRVSRERTVAAVRSAGLDERRAAADMTKAALRAEIKKNLELGRSLGLSGTPSFIVGNKILSGAVGLPALQADVAAARDAKAG